MTLFFMKRRLIITFFIDDFMNWLKFLGTAGARFVMMQQQRATGGIWVSLDDTTLLIDPGPGSLVRCLSSRPKLNPRTLDGIILTHRHLDHSNDVNIIIEAMTNGGFDQKGVLLAPADALDEDPVVLQYIRDHLDTIKKLSENSSYAIKNLKISTGMLHHHGVETYGLNIHGTTVKISLISDTKYFKGLETPYDGDILIANVVLYNEKSYIQHLSLKDVRQILHHQNPKVCILTHFGMTMLKAKPWELAEQLTKETGVKVIAARDGMKVNLDEYAH